jgi:hypothetical protein
MRLFRITNGTSIPWAIIEPHEQQALKNHRQSLAELQRRGGLSPCEAVAVLEDRQWAEMPLPESKSRLEDLVKTNYYMVRIEQAEAHLRRIVEAWVLWEECACDRESPHGGVAVVACEHFHAVFAAIEDAAKHLEGA